MNVGDLKKVNIIDLGHKGEGIGKIENMAIFINGAILGDQVLAKIVKLKKNYAIGELIKITKKSDYRVDSVCSISEKCGGCQIIEMDYTEQLKFKKNLVKENLKRIGNIDVEVEEIIGMKNPYNYRNKAQIPIGKLNKKVIMGFYEMNSHKIVDSDDCKIQDERNTLIINIIKNFVETFNISIYNEEKSKGLLRHIVTRVGNKTGDIMIILVVNGNELPNSDILVETLKDKIDGVKSIVLSINKSKGNKILGDKTKVIYKNDYIEDYIGDIKFKISTNSFYQVNSSQTYALYKKAVEYAGINKNDVVLDLYCGIGSISLFLAKEAKKVIGVEVVESAIKNAKENALLNNINNVEFILGKAEDELPNIFKKGEKPSTIVVDPPRKGLDSKVIDTIIKMSPNNIVYVSCNPSTLARDLKLFNDNGYNIDKVSCVDMFPHTSHVECIVLMSRNEK